MRVLSALGRRAGGGMLLAVATVLASPAAVAEEANGTEGLRLTWSAPEGCPSGAEVAADVARILRSASSRHRALRADARVSGRGARWHLTLTTTTDEGRGERELDASTCRAVADAAALIVALAIDPSASSPPPPAGAAAAAAPAAEPGSPPGTPALAGASTTPADAVATRTPPTTPGTPATAEGKAAARPASATVEGKAAARPASATTTANAVVPLRRHMLVVALSGAANVGQLPAAGVGGELVVGWTPAPFRIEIIGDAWLGQSAALAARPGVGGDLRALGLGARACVAARVLTQAELGPCVGALVESIAGSGFGARTALSGAATWVDVSAGGFASVALVGPLSARLALEATVPLARPTFVVLHDGVTEPLHRPAFLAGKGTIGLEARFF